MAVRAAAALALFLLALLPGPASAAGELHLDGMVLSWEEGVLSRRDLNGDARGVRLLFESGAVGTADRLVLRSRMAGGEVVVERLLLANLILEFRDETLAVAELEWRGLRFSGGSLRDPLEPEFDDGDVTAFGTLEVGGGGFTSDEGTVTVGWARMDSRPVSLSALPGRLLHEGSVSVRNLALLPDFDANERRNYRGFLAWIGRDSLTFDLDVTGNVVELADRVDTDIAFKVDADGLGEVAGSFGLGLPNSALRMFGFLDRDDRRGRQEAGAVLLAGMLLNKAEVRLRESGLLAAVMEFRALADGISRREQVELIMGELLFTYGTLAPQHWNVVAPPVRAFLEGGGELAVSMRPTAPVRIATLPGLASSPDAALSILGLDVRHRFPR